LSDRASVGVFVGCADGSIKILAMESSSFKEVARLGSSHAGGVASLAVSPRGDLLASGGEDGTLRFWRISS
jgi:WD40 repeat protein